MKIQPVRGTHDLYAGDLLKFKVIEKRVNEFVNLYNFTEIITPMFEFTDLFKKPLGENSDVVLKEMYTFNDKNDSSITLRPEFTTPTLRSAISNNFVSNLPQKLFSMGPVFRRERPQKGRYRQFNQINFEILGTEDPIADVELIILANNILKAILNNKNISLSINSLGDKNTLDLYKKELIIYFKKFQKDLSIDSQSKIINNPLRILDSKNTTDMEICKNTPLISNFYSKEAKERFTEVQRLLSASLIDYTINCNLVRGLDYYCHTVFEFKTNDLGSQDTLIGGGRYDGLIRLLGGPNISGVGWAGGIERIMMLMDDVVLNHITVHLILMEKKYKIYGLKIANELRSNNISVYNNYKYNLKKSLSIANQLGVEYAIIIGENEFSQKLCTIKNLIKNEQKTITIKEIIKELIL